jgi:hypothetical protein
MVGPRAEREAGAAPRRARPGHLLANEILQAGAPPFDSLQATPIAAEALTPPAACPWNNGSRAWRHDRSETAPGMGRIPAASRQRARQDRQRRRRTTISRKAPAARSAGERYQRPQPSRAWPPRRSDGCALCRRAASGLAEAVRAACARRDSGDTHAAPDLRTVVGTGEYVISPADADDAIVRRIVDAAALPDLLGRETATAMLEASAADSAVVFVRLPGGSDIRLVAAVGGDLESAKTMARSAVNGQSYGRGSMFIEPLGRDVEGPRFVLVASPSDRPPGDAASAHDRVGRAPGIRSLRRARSVDQLRRQRRSIDRSSRCCLAFTASAAMSRLVEQIQRLQGNDLTVLVTGESGTGKELVARAIHVGSHRSAAMFLPYNCTTTGRELADSQLFGHRREVHGRRVRPAGTRAIRLGGDAVPDEIGDLPIDVQPKLLRFLELQEILPSRRNPSAARRRSRRSRHERRSPSSGWPKANFERTSTTG